MNQFTTLSEAVQFAMTRCSSWRFAYSDEVYDHNSLPGIAEIHDEENPTDEDSFYLVSPGGAIGFTEDNGDDVDWLFLPESDTGETLPSSFTVPLKINFCPQCGKPVEPGARFCGGCGEKLC